MSCLKPFLNKKLSWNRTPLGLETALLVSRALRWPVEGSERRWKLREKVPALHREAERDTTGSFSRQPALHTWIARDVQGSVAAGQHRGLFACVP
jgi:hypothetical protein